MSQPVRKILVLTGDHYSPDSAKRDGQYNEEDFVTHNAMVEALQSFTNYTVEVCNNHAKLEQMLDRNRPDLVLNFCDTGFRNVIAHELHIPAMLELAGIPYSGAPPQAIVMCYDKAIVRLAAQALGVPVPDEFYLAAQTPVDEIPNNFPVLIKPNAADGSLGITKDAVVRSREAAIDYLNWLRKTLPGTDTLMQEYLPGPEYGVGLIGNPETEIAALPLLEVDFSGLPAGLNPILSYESKAIPDSPYWTDIKFKPAQIPADQEKRLVDNTKRLFKRFGLRDYGRFDFRADKNGIIKLMEVNPNPAWGNDGKLAFMTSFSGRKYSDMLQEIISAAETRISLQAD